MYKDKLQIKARDLKNRYKYKINTVIVDVAGGQNTRNDTRL